MNEYRTHNCGELNEKNIGSEVKLSGWVQKIRNLGGMVFIDLRDQFGITQIVVSSEEMQNKVKEITTESSVCISGKVVERASKNPNLSTGSIEVVANSIEILGKCKNVLPFEVNTDQEVREDLRLEYRFLDLRNEKLHNNIMLRSKILKTLRDKMDELGFAEIQTPILANSSPEGARDFLVPSRLHPGEFYQLDFEMAYSTQEDVFKILEEVVPYTFKKFTNWKVDEGEFIRIPYREAMEKYGIDKPDLRNPLIIQDVTKVFEHSEFKAFAGKTVKAIVVENGAEQGRKFFDKMTDFAVEEAGAKGLAWVKFEQDGNVQGGIAKFINEEMQKELVENYGVKPNSSIFFIGDEFETAQKIAGLVRIELGKRLDLIEKNVYKFCWIVDFPMYELSDEGKIDFCHNPFSMPQGGMEALEKMEPLDILAYQYDLVCNGYEMASGAVRNHNPEIMVKAFEIAGYEEEEIKNRFGALYNAFQYGTPPHAGAAPGVDRMVMLITDSQNIREIIAFPKNKKARDLLMRAPSRVMEEQLKDVHIKIEE